MCGDWEALTLVPPPAFVHEPHHHVHRGVVFLAGKRQRAAVRIQENGLRLLNKSVSRDRDLRE